MFYSKTPPTSYIAKFYCTNLYFCIKKLICLRTNQSTKYLIYN
nr:MAG TPA: hypothetical protein [Caudoviricetes sp.]